MVLESIDGNKVYLIRVDDRQVSKELARDFCVAYSGLCRYSPGWAVGSQPSFRRWFGILCLWGCIVFGQHVSSFFRNSHCWLAESRKPESGELRDSCYWVSLCPCWHGFTPKMDAQESSLMFITWFCSFLLYICIIVCTAVCSHLKFPIICFFNSAHLFFVLRDEKYRCLFLKKFPDPRFRQKSRINM